MSLDETDLSPRDREIAAALAAGRTYDETVEIVGCSRATVGRVAARYRTEIIEERHAIARRVSHLLRDAAIAAASVVADVLENEPSNVTKLQAARIALGEALRWADAIDTDERLRAVEARLGLRAVANA